jgi:hypothetical protein
MAARRRAAARVREAESTGEGATESGVEMMIRECRACAASGVFGAAGVPARGAVYPKN